MVLSSPICAAITKCHRLEILETKELMSVLEVEVQDQSTSRLVSGEESGLSCQDSILLCPSDGIRTVSSHGRRDRRARKYLNLFPMAHL